MKRLNVLLFMAGLGLNGVLSCGMGGRLSSYLQKYYKNATESAQEAMKRYGPQIKDYAQEQGPKLVQKMQNLRQYGSELAEQYGPRIKSGAESFREAASGAQRYAAERIPEVTHKVVEKYPQVRSWWGNLASRISSYWNPVARQSVSNAVRPIEEQVTKASVPYIERPIEPGAAYLVRRQKAVTENFRRDQLLYGRGGVPAEKIIQYQNEYDRKYLARELEQQKLNADLRYYE